MGCKVEHSWTKLFQGHPTDTHLNWYLGIKKLSWSFELSVTVLGPLLLSFCGVKIAVAMGHLNEMLFTDLNSNGIG